MATDPFDLLKKANSLQMAVKDLSNKVDSISRRNVEAGSLGELAPQMGQVSIANNWGIIDENGMLLNGGSMNIEFWASIGVPSNIFTVIRSVAFSGTTLYVGGIFTKIGGINANYIAKYDIITGVWSNVGSATALNGSVFSIVVSGSDVYIGGNFTDAGGVADADYIAKWSGSAWSALGAGSLNSTVYEIAVSGSDLYVGGAFLNAGGVADADYIAKWNGSAWSALGSGIIAPVQTVAVIGSDVYAAGGNVIHGGSDRIVKWNGSAWSALGSGLNSYVNKMAVSETELYVGGGFTGAGGVVGADYVAKWSGSAWSALGDIPLADVVYTMAVNGTDLYIGGYFSNAGGVADADYIAKWNGSAWSALGSGLNGSCYAICFHGNDLYCGGQFTQASGRASKGVAAFLQTLESVLAYLEVSGQALQDSLIPIWTAVSFQNSWVDYGGSYAPASYWKEGVGIVHLRGLVKSGTIGLSIFTLPIGYRPAYTFEVLVDSNATVGVCVVNTDGTVVAASGSNAYFSLDGITVYT